jgi:exopolysaccharide biosynthesis protein
MRAQTDAWEQMADGLELGRFRVDHESSGGDSAIVVLRIDPNIWELKILAISETGDERGMSAKQWCDKYNLVAAINAGMFDIDYKTHIGYMKVGEHINSSRINSYKSAAAFNPLRKESPPFRIFDLDTDSLDSIKADYGCVVQNLRLIKRPRENRWSQKQDKWSEAALGEDDQGRILFILCRSRYTMHDFCNILLSLPINLVSAQHLEGGPEAQMYLNMDDVKLELAGSHETDLNENDNNIIPWPIPNVFGVVKREPKK